MEWSRPFLLNSLNMRADSTANTRQATASPMYRATSVCTSARVAATNNKNCEITREI